MKARIIWSVVVMVFVIGGICSIKYLGTKPVNPDDYKRAIEKQKEYDSTLDSLNSQVQKLATKIKIKAMSQDVSEMKKQEQDLQSQIDATQAKIDKLAEAKKTMNTVWFALGMTVIWLGCIILIGILVSFAL